MLLLLPSTATRNGGIDGRTPVRYGLWLLLVLQLVAVAVAKCPNWCSQHGVCTGPGDDAFCICEMGFQGDDCGISEFEMCMGKKNGRTCAGKILSTKDRVL